MKSEKYLGIDYGQSRIGLAMSDALLSMAHPYQTLPAKPFEKAVEAICTTVRQEQITALVIGLPKRSDIAFSESEQKAKSFAAILEERLKLPIHFVDERYSTVIAHQMLSSSGLKTKKHKNVVDQVAAQVILQDFLDKKRRNDLMDKTVH